jgi:chromosome segregation ATPase
MNNYTTEQLLMCEKEDLVEYIEELQEKYDCLMSDSHNEVSLAEHEDALEDLQNDLDFQSNGNTELTKENEKLKALHSQAVKEMDEWKMKCVEVGVDKQHLKEQAQITCDCKDVEIEALKDEIETLRDQGGHKTEEISDLNGKRMDLFDENEKLKKQLAVKHEKHKAANSLVIEYVEEVAVLKDEVQVWEREQEELTEQNEKLKKQLEEVSKMNARVWKQLKRWPKKPDFNLSDDEEEKVEVKGTITITSDTEPFEEMVVEFSETITKEQYEDEDWMENIDDHLKLTEPYSVAGCDIQIDFK